MCPVFAFGFLGLPSLGARQDPQNSVILLTVTPRWQTWVTQVPASRWSTHDGLLGCLHGGAGVGELRIGAVMWGDLKRVLLGAVGQGHVVWESMELTQPTGRKSQCWLCLELGRGDEV